MIKNLLFSISILIEKYVAVFFHFFFFYRLAQSARLMMALAIFLSYGLQFYVPMNIMGPWFRSLFASEYAQNLSDSALRIGLIISTCKLLTK